MTKCRRGEWGCTGTVGSRPTVGRGSYLERGHGGVPAIPVYGVELGRVVELMVQLRMSFASVHHFLEGKDRKGQQKMNQREMKENKRTWGREGNGARQRSRNEGLRCGQR